MGFDGSREKLVGTGVGAKRGKNALLLTVTMGTLVPKDPQLEEVCYYKGSYVRVKGNCGEIRHAG